MAMRLYIYCKLRPADDGVCLRATVADVGAACGVPARLERRVGDPETWMEVYGPLEPDATAALVAALAAAWVRHGVDTHVVGGGAGRTLEWFEDAGGA